MTKPLASKWADLLYIHKNESIVDFTEITKDIDQISNSEHSKVTYGEFIFLLNNKGFVVSELNNQTLDKEITVGAAAQILFDNFLYFKRSIDKKR